MAARTQRDVVLVRGSDAREHLQGLLTQDVIVLGVGESAWSFLLEPKGEIVALMRVTRSGDDEIALDMDPGYGQAVRERVEGFTFRMDISFESHQWPGLSWRGPGANAVVAEAPIVMHQPWPGCEGLDVVGPGVELPADAEELGADELDAVRIRLGWPSMADLDAKTTPAMTGIIDHTVSFTKGCYPGQELVARMHYRAAEPPRRLVQVGFHPSARAEPGDPISFEGDEVGALTSVSEYQPLALAWLKRSVPAPCDATMANAPICVGVLPAQVTERAPEPPRTTTSPLTLS